MALQPKKCKQCKKSFRGQETSKFCSNKCRQAAYRRRINPTLKKRDKSQVQVLEPVTCIHCQKGFWAKSKKALYCSDSCRVLSYRHRRNDAIATLAILTGVSLKNIEDVADSLGIQRVHGLLQQYGYIYQPAARQWQPVTTHS